MRGTGIPGETVIAVTTLQPVISSAGGVPAVQSDAVTRHQSVVAITAEELIVSASSGIAIVVCANHPSCLVIAIATE